MRQNSITPQETLQENKTLGTQPYSTNQLKHEGETNNNCTNLSYIDK